MKLCPDLYIMLTGIIRLASYSWDSSLRLVSTGSFHNSTAPGINSREITPIFVFLESRIFFPVTTPSLLAEYQP